MSAPSSNTKRSLPSGECTSAILQKLMMVFRNWLPLTTPSSTSNTNDRATDRRHRRRLGRSQGSPSKTTPPLARYDHWQWGTPVRPGRNSAFDRLELSTAERTRNKKRFARRPAFCSTRSSSLSNVYPRNSYSISMLPIGQ